MFIAGFGRIEQSTLLDPLMEKNRRTGCLWRNTTTVSAFRATLWPPFYVPQANSKLPSTGKFSPINCAVASLYL